MEEKELKRLSNQMIKEQLLKASEQSEFAGGLNLSSGAQSESVDILREQLNEKD